MAALAHATGPDGATTADEWNGTGSLERTVFAASASTTYTHTFRAKAGTATTVAFSGQARPAFSSTAQATVNLSTGALTGITGTATSVDIGNGWWEVSVTAATPAGTTGIVQIYNTADGTMYLTEFQSELGVAGTSFIETTTAAASRSADNASRTDVSFLTPGKGTMVIAAENRAISTGDDRRMVTFDQGGGGVPYFYMYVASNNRPATLIDFQITGGDLGAAVPAASTAALTPFKVASAWQEDDVASTLNAGTLVTDSDFDVTDTGITRMLIGNDHFGRYFNGWIRSIEYYNTRKPNSFLLQKTSE